MTDNGPNFGGSSFEPVREETLLALEEAIFDSPYKVPIEPKQVAESGRNLGPFLYLELENKDQSGGAVSIFVDGEWIAWFDEEVTVHSIELMQNFTSEGWHNTHYTVVRNEDGEMLAFKQISIANEDDASSFTRLLHKALKEGDDESMAELYAEALKHREAAIVQAKALEAEHALGLSQVSEEETQELIGYIETGYKPTN